MCWSRSQVLLEIAITYKSSKALPVCAEILLVTYMVLQSTDCRCRRMVTDQLVCSLETILVLDVRAEGKSSSQSRKMESIGGNLLAEMFLWTQENRPIKNTLLLESGYFETLSRFADIWRCIRGRKRISVGTNQAQVAHFVPRECRSTLRSI